MKKVIWLIICLTVPIMALAEQNITIIKPGKSSEFTLATEANQISSIAVRYSEECNSATMLIFESLHPFLIKEGYCSYTFDDGIKLYYCKFPLSVTERLGHLTFKPTATNQQIRFHTE